MLTRHLTVFLIDYLIIDDESVKIHQVLFWIVSLNACIIFKTFFLKFMRFPQGLFDTLISIFRTELKD